MWKKWMEIVDFFDLPMKDFTILIKEFYKNNWWHYNFELSLSDSQFIYKKSIEFINNESNNNISRYNALRLLKVTLSCKDDDFFKEIYSEILDLILKYLNHKYWNFRMEVINLLWELKFRTTIKTEVNYWRKTTKKIKEKYEHYWPLLIEFYLMIEKNDIIYQKINRDNLKYKDLSIDWYIPYSWDTKNITLKYFRKVLEELGSELFDNKMKEFWYI